MYQRSYYPTEKEQICPPKEYDGSIRFCEDKREDEVNPCQDACIEDCKKSPSIFPFGINPSGLFGGLEIGIEEILIIGAVIFLFMSKSGDFECIFILIALLFVR